MIYFFEVNIMEDLESKRFNEAEKRGILFSDSFGNFEKYFCGWPHLPNSVDNTAVWYVSGINSGSHIS